MTTTIHRSALALLLLLGLGCDVATVRPFVEELDGGPGGTGGTLTDASVGDCVSDLDCPTGEECEIEDGSSFCKPHGGDGGGGTGGDGGSGGDGGRSGSNSGPG
jgi:hypothetical protein